MTNTYVISAKELLVALVGLSGELPFSGLADRQNKYSSLYFQNTISLLCREKVVRKVKNSEGEEFIRLSIPRGDEYLKNISLGLYNNFLVMSEAGKDSPARRYKGDAKRRSRREQMGKLITSFYELGCSVNGFSFEVGENAPADMELGFLLRKQAVFREDGSIMPVEEIFQRIKPAENVFLSCQTLRMQGNERIPHAREESSRKYGLCQMGERFFLVYYLNDVGYTWTRDIERYNRQYLEQKTEKSVDGLFIAKSMEIYGNLIKPVKITKALCQPLFVFENAHVILEGEQGSVSLKLLTSKDFEKVIIKALIPSVEEGSGLFIGMLYGVPIFSFLTGNLKSLQEAKRYFAEENSGFLLVMDYQKEAVIKFLGPSSDAEDRLLVFDSEIVKTVIKSIEEGKKNADI